MRYIPSGVSTGSPDHSQPLLFLIIRFPHISPNKEKLEKVSEQLQCDILKSKGRAMEQLQNEGLVVQLLQGRDVRMSECPV